MALSSPTISDGMSWCHNKFERFSRCPRWIRGKGSQGLLPPPLIPPAIDTHKPLITSKYLCAVHFAPTSIRAPTLPRKRGFIIYFLNVRNFRLVIACGFSSQRMCLCHDCPFSFSILFCCYFSRNLFTCTPSPPLSCQKVMDISLIPFLFLLVK